MKITVKISWTYIAEIESNIPIATYPHFHPIQTPLISWTFENCWNTNTLNTSSNTIKFLSGCFIDCLRVYAVLISMAPLLFLGNCKSFFFFEFGNYKSLHILLVSAWVIRSDTKTWIINLFHSFDYRDWFKHAHQLNRSNLIRAFQIKTAGHLYTFFKIAKISNNETTASGQDVENRNSHSLVVAIQNYIATRKTV